MSLCDIAVSKCFWTPLSHCHLLFLGKPFFYDPGHKIWIHSFVTFRNPICSSTYGIILVWLHVFNFLLDLHNAYMESRLKTTHCLFKWCCPLKAVFIAVYWPLVLGNFIYIVRVKMAVGNSARQQWASLNKHFLSKTSLFVDFYGKYIFICWQVKCGRFKIKW